MRRREFLRLGGLSSLGAAMPAAAAAQGPQFDAASLATTVLNMDAGVAAMRAGVAQRIDTVAALSANIELKQAMRLTLSGFFAYQAFCELPLEMQVHPDVQDRVFKAGHDIDAGIAALRVELRQASDAEVEALDGLFARGGRDFDSVVARVDRGYGRRGGSVNGRRRFNRLADMARRDVSEKGLKNALQGYFDEVDDIQQRPPKRRVATEKARRRVAAAQAMWMKQGVPKSRFTADRGNSDAMRALGITLIVVGSIITVIGLLALVCPCIGIPIILIGVALIIVGAVVLNKNKRPRGERAVAEAESEPDRAAPELATPAEPVAPDAESGL
ncbi:MAG: hypothetical protein ACI8PZ_001071 [Myxococcota bacterium]